ncbi:hypothetical protein G4V62_07050 [Bacillaceae bacterium SIJ1]|uniref:hypothetical protein n=1 Tax=Litoribacterium kuwaitense TaxID=1398745 RepID=UPI0013EAE4A8|nr:hypothetical protein [Litoribacterium kuwaitense]NGP44722.1 hypothetical protein [Litoribacterium kuwaitense]
MSHIVRLAKEDELQKLAAFYDESVCHIDVLQCRAEEFVVMEKDGHLTAACRLEQHSEDILLTSFLFRGSEGAVALYAFIEGVLARVKQKEASAVYVIQETEQAFTLFSWFGFTKSALDKEPDWLVAQCKQHSKSKVLKWSP